MSNPQPAADTVLHQAAIAKFLNLDRVTVYRMDRAGILPPPDIVIGRRRGRYLSTIKKFAEQSVQARCPIA